MDDEREHAALVASIRGLARKAGTIGRLAAERVGHGRRVKEVLTDAVRLLDAAAELVYRPRIEVPRLAGQRELAPNPERVALEMTRFQRHLGPPAAGPANAVSVLSGNARSIPIRDILGLLGAIRKNGVLTVRTASEKVTIQLEDGHVVHAASNNSPPGERLGDVLVAEGMVEKERFERFLRKHTRSAGLLGVALEREELVSREQLTRALSIQIERLFQRLFATREASYSFQERPVAGPDHRVRLPLEQLLLESAPAEDVPGA